MENFFAVRGTRDSDGVWTWFRADGSEIDMSVPTKRKFNELDPAMRADFLFSFIKKMYKFDNNWYKIKPKYKDILTAFNAWHDEYIEDYTYFF